MSDDLKVTAAVDFHGQKIENVPVLNPGGWFGRTWLLEIGGSYTPLFLVVEADSASDAIDELADNEQYGHEIRIPDSDLGDYGEDVYRAGNDCAPCDLDHLAIHGDDHEGFKGVVYRVDGVDVDILPTDWDEAEKMIPYLSAESTDLDWDGIKADMEAEEWEEDNDNPEMECRCVYLGTVMNLIPSGKYYMPWACSNVCEIEAMADEAWWDLANEEADKLGYSIQCGEGDPCDVFALEYRDKPERTEEGTD